MRALAILTEELEARPGDADRVDALARHLRAVGRDAGALAGEWLVADAGLRSARPPRLTQAALAEAARALAAAQGMAPWLFDAGRAEAGEAAEAIALLLPWPEGPPTPASRPSLAGWLADWARAASQPGPARAAAIAGTIARLDDALARRWAVRAVCGLVRPVVDPWQWQRAWARAFDAHPQDVAWEWHRRRGARAPGAAAAPGPRPRAFAPLDEPGEPAHAGLLAAWRRGDLDAEPRWHGVRVHVVRHGDDVAVWQRDGRLLNDRLPAAWLSPAQWPEDAVVEAVLVAWMAGRLVALPEPRAGVRERAEAGPTLHLALVDWHAAPQAPRARRARLLARWPAPDGLAALPPIFTTPRWPAPAADADALVDVARAARAQGWSGLVLRHAASGAAWAVRAPIHRVRAALQYVPGDALGAGDAAALALGLLDCGFALWNRLPRSEEERRAAMTAAMSGRFIDPPDEAPEVAALRLLPLARVPIALPDDELRRLHGWLRANAGQRFGGVHAVAPVQVFELGFAQVRPSRRHRIGATLAGVTVLRWLADAPPGGAQLADDLFLGTLAQDPFARDAGTHLA